MEASSSGMYHSTAHGIPSVHASPHFVIFCAPYQQGTGSRQRKASLCLVRGSVRRKGGGQHGHTSSRYRQSTAVRAQEAEVISQGEVADVEEIEGIRVLMTEQKRPMVEYLIKWKVTKLSGVPAPAQAARMPADMCLLPRRTALHTRGKVLFPLHDQCGSHDANTCMLSQGRLCAGSLRKTLRTTCCATLRLLGGRLAERCPLVVFVAP